MTDLTMTNAPVASTFGQRLGAILTLGFGIAVSVWVAAFIAHLPWLDLPANVAGPVVLAVWLAAAVVGARSLGAARERWLVCVGAGVLTALLTLLIFNSLLVEQPAIDQAPKPGASGLRPNAALLMAGFVALGAGIGAAGCLIAGRRAVSARTSLATSEVWHASMATVAAVSIVPLLVVGGKVTSAKAGMAIIGWPGSDGANMFLYPIALMANPARFLEHTHRLFGALVGLNFLALMIYTFVASRSLAVRLYSVGLFIAVVVQGKLGGDRVNSNSLSLAAMHGILAQLFFASAVAFAARVRGLFAKGASLAPVPAGSLRVLAWVLIVCLFMQLVFGAMYRHLGHLHALWSHVGFSVVVLVMCIVVGAKLKGVGQRAEPGSRADAGRRTLSRVGSGLSHVVGLQFVLGWIALWAALTVKDRTIPVGSEVLTAEPVPVLTMLVRTAHQANGALLLALASLGLVWAVWLTRGSPRRAAASARANMATA